MAIYLWLLPFACYAGTLYLLYIDMPFGIIYGSMALILVGIPVCCSMIYNRTLGRKRGYVYPTGKCVWWFGYHVTVGCVAGLAGWSNIELGTSPFTAVFLSGIGMFCALGVVWFYYTMGVLDGDFV